MPLQIQLTCPAPAGSTMGNRVTALRWMRILRALGHRARISDSLRGAPDLLVALHARKSAAAISEFKARFPKRPVVLALTGTDLYGDLRKGQRAALHSLDLADRLVVLHAGALRALPRAVRGKTRVIHQSVVLPKRLDTPDANFFDVCVMSHLRPVKDPMRAAMASRLAKRSSTLRIRHLGRPLNEHLVRRARRETKSNARYSWLGELPRGKALRIFSQSKLLVLSSRMEGGANVIGEAAVLGVAIIASDIEGNRGLLGPRHPGYFPVGDTRALALLLARAETEPKFLRRLEASSSRIAPLFAPETERAAWVTLCGECLA